MQHAIYKDKGIQFNLLKIEAFSHFLFFLHASENVKTIYNFLRRLL